MRSMQSQKYLSKTVFIVDEVEAGNNNMLARYRTYGTTMVQKRRMEMGQQCTICGNAIV